MKQNLVFLFIFCPVIMVAQNVGIGTSSPTGKLQVNHRSSTAVGLKLVDSSSNNAGTVEFRNVSNTRRMIVEGYTSSDFNNGQYLDIHSDSAYAATFRGNGYVGIRNTDPQYPLDLNGDINTTGALRANGSAGNNGQVLRSNGDGTMTWADMSEYKNMATFRTAGSGNWTVPAGVTKVWIEVWGGGAGGNYYSGGGGGAYVSGIITVTAGSDIFYSVGAGGAGGFDNATNGTLSSITSDAGITLTAQGGVAPTYSAGPPGVISNGFGGNYSVSPLSFLSFYGEKGQNGQVVQSTILTFPSASYEVTNGGKGGDAGHTTNTGGASNTSYYNLTSSTLVRYSNALANPVTPGGGGGSGLRPLIGGLALGGSAGAEGMVIIHY